jgi:CRISPR-associated protein Csm5
MEEKQFNEIHFLEIETLSPVHVGSGNRLKRDFEYLEFPAPNRDGPRIAAITDLEKVLNVLGEKRIPQWLTAIDRGESTLNLLRQVNPAIRPLDISSRLVEFAFSDRRMFEFKEMILDGDGHPYIPGSSLKGAFRTALLAEGLRAKGREFRMNLDAWKGKVNRFFGKDMNTEVMRFLMPSDTTFYKTQCLAIDILNQYHDGWGIKETRDSLFVEAIPAGARGYSRLVLPRVLFKELDKTHDAQGKARDHGILPKHAPRWPQLLRSTHDHNLRLLRKEIAFWNSEKNPAIVGAYVEQLSRILEKAERFDPEKEALMRLGFATGWKSITGEWQEDCMHHEDFKELMRKLNPTPFAYPKTRKLALCEQPLGYLRVRQCEKDLRFVPRPRKSGDLPTPLPPPVQNIPVPVSPQYHPGPFRKGTEVEAEYCPQPKDQGAMKTFKLLMWEPGREQMVALRYPAALPAGQRVRVRINDIDAKTSVVRAIEFRAML